MEASLSFFFDGVLIFRKSNQISNIPIIVPSNGFTIINIIRTIEIKKEKNDFVLPRSTSQRLI
jgi:hypothetical protein